MNLDALNAIKDVLGKNRYELEAYPVPQKGPFALVCAGGGYNMVCSFVEGRPYARALNKLGYSAFVLKYRVGDLARYPAPQEDLARAVRSILEHADEWNVEREGYALFGSSAGGHLAATFARADLGYAHYGLPKPAALVLAYPVTLMDERGHRESTEKLLGADPSQEEILEKSIPGNVTSDFPPTFLWNSGADATVPPVNSALLAQALEEAGVKHEYICYENVKHGAGLARGTSAQGWMDRAVAFWEEVRKGA